MAAPKNNEFWKLRSKHGRDKIFATPEIMKDAADEYFQHQSQQQWVKTDFRGKESQMVEIPTSSPFTLTGLCIFLGVNTVYFNQFEKECSEDFSKVIMYIREVIYTQKFEGAAVGAYNANIIARDLGLVDKKDVTEKTVVELTDEQLKNEIEAIRKEILAETDGDNI